LCNDAALQEVPSSTYQDRYLVSVIAEHGVLKIFSESLGPTGGESVFETYKTCKGLKLGYMLLLGTQETMSQKQPYFVLKHMRLCVGD